MSKETLIDQIFDKDIDMRGRTIWLYGDVDDDLLKKFSKHHQLLYHVFIYLVSIMLKN